MSDQAKADEEDDMHVYEFWPQLKFLPPPSLYGWKEKDWQEELEIAAKWGHDALNVLIDRVGGDVVMESLLELGKRIEKLEAEQYEMTPEERAQLIREAMLYAREKLEEELKRYGKPSKN